MYGTNGCRVIFWGLRSVARAHRVLHFSGTRPFPTTLRGSKDRSCVCSWFAFQGKMRMHSYFVRHGYLLSLMNFRKYLQKPKTPNATAHQLHHRVLDFDIILFACNRIEKHFRYYNEKQLGTQNASNDPLFYSYPATHGCSSLRKSGKIIFCDSDGSHRKS